MARPHSKVDPCGGHPRKKTARYTEFLNPETLPQIKDSSECSHRRCLIHSTHMGMRKGGILTRLKLGILFIHAYTKYLRKTGYHSQYYPMTPQSAVAYR